jgi:hypothetical protein
MVLRMWFGGGAGSLLSLSCSYESVCRYGPELLTRRVLLLITPGPCLHVTAQVHMNVPPSGFVFRPNHKYVEPDGKCIFHANVYYPDRGALVVDILPNTNASRTQLVQPGHILVRLHALRSTCQ